MELPFQSMMEPHTGPIIEIRPASGGSGFATAALVTAREGEFFVKGVPNRPGGRLDAARREAAINPSLGGLAPRLRFRVENREWFVLGFEVVKGRHPDYAPGSADLPQVARIVDQITALSPPAVATDWQESRWDRFSDHPEMLRGSTLTYNDLHPNNILMGPEQTWVVDWEWPTLAAGFLTAGCLVGQLISAGHGPAEAESCVSEGREWQAADPAAIDEFARAQVCMQEWVVEQLPDQTWRQAMLAAEQEWCRYREELKAGR